MKSNQLARAYAVLAFAVLVAATSSILIRYAQQRGVPSLVIATGRVLIASSLMALVYGRSALSHWAQLPAKLRGQAALAGLFLALHFATWISSLAYTSVAASAALVTTNPIWVGLFSAFFLGEKLPALSIAGIVTSVLGSLVILLNAEPHGNLVDPLFGNVLALLGAISVSGYFLMGRGLRASMPLTAYLLIVNCTAGLVLLALTVGSLLWAQPASPSFAWLHDPQAWFWVAMLAIGPQLMGHGAINWSLRHLSTTFVALSILGEPLGSALFAWVLFGEQVTGSEILGFALLMFGIILGAWAEARQQATPH